MSEPNEKVLESRVHRKAARLGYRVMKSRQRPHYENQGEFMLFDDHALPLLGWRYDASLPEIEQYLDEVLA
jgi:hypothetical protein